MNFDLVLACYFVNKAEWQWNCRFKISVSANFLVKELRKKKDIKSPGLSVFRVFQILPQGQGCN